MPTQDSHQNTLFTLALAILIIAAVFFFIRSTVNRTVTEPDVQITAGEITITGMYGETYPLTSITGMTLKEGTPQLGKKIRGAGLTRQQAYRGRYEVEGLGACLVFLFGDQGPYIQLETAEETILIMYSQEQRTLDLYEQLEDTFYE